MTTVSFAWSYGRFREIKSKLRRKKPHKTNQASNFLGGSFSIRENVRAPIQFRRESQPRTLKYGFSSRTDPSIFTSMPPALLDWSNETSWVFSTLKYQQASSCPSSVCLVDQIQIQKPVLVVVIDQMPDHTYSRE